MTATATEILDHNARRFTRVSSRLSGSLFLPAEDTSAECTVTNLSTHGAGILCFEPPPPLGALVVLYIEGFGRFDCVTRHFTSGELGVEIQCRDAKRKRFEADLIAYACDGLKGITRLRNHPRNPAMDHTCFTLDDGTNIVCELSNVSLQGAYLKTLARPKIGEIVTLGMTCGCVMRHDHDGIAIEFLQLT